MGDFVVADVERQEKPGICEIMCAEFKPLRRACKQESDNNKNNLKLFIKYVCNVS